MLQIECAKMFIQKLLFKPNVIVWLIRFRFIYFGHVERERHIQITQQQQQKNLKVNEFQRILKERQKPKIKNGTGEIGDHTHGSFLCIKSPFR